MPKLSDIAAAASPPALIDRLVGVTSGKVDELFTLAQIQTTAIGSVIGSGAPGISKSGSPLFTDVASGNWAVIHDNSTDNVTLAYNAGGFLLTMPFDLAVIDAHSNPFITYNLFNGTEGPYWTHVNAWNVGSLTPAQYSETISNVIANFPNGGITFTWSYPATAVVGNVYAYPELIYGTQGPHGFNGFPIITPTPKQINSFANLSLTYTMTRTFADADSDCLIETWVSDTATRTNPIISEVMFLAHGAAGNIGQVLALPLHFNYSAGGVNCYVGSTTDHTFIIIMPVTAPNGTTPLEMTNGTFTINFLPLIQAIVSQGWFAGTNYLTGFEFGFEVAKNSGSATITGFAWTWN
jgi:hypothetical protein